MIDKEPAHTRAVLTSVNKLHIDKIFAIDLSERKTVEWRTKPLPKGKHYVYETKKKGGRGKVVGEMIVFGWARYDNVDEIQNGVIRNGKVSREFLKTYAKGKALYANGICDSKRYEQPKELGEFKKQNPCYYSGSWEELGCWERGCVWKDKGDCDGRCSSVERPPQSWMYVEELKQV